LKICIGIGSLGLRENVERAIKGMHPDFLLIGKKEDADIIILSYSELNDPRSDFKAFQVDKEKFYGIFHFEGWKTEYPPYDPGKVQIFNLEPSIWVAFDEFLRRIGMGCRNLIFNPYKEAAF